MNLKIPFLTDKAIETQAEHFRREYYGNEIPFNPEYVWDGVLGKHVVPFQDLKKLAGIEAALSVSMDKMLVDSDAIQSKKYPGRLAFSMSHELGHYHLHKECLLQLRLQSVSMWQLYLESIDQTTYIRLEYHADKFATFLMMPSIEVAKAASELTQYLITESPLKEQVSFEDQVFRRYFATQLANQFNVSIQAMDIRLTELSLWPDV